jgi:hypothetical protein
MVSPELPGETWEIMYADGSVVYNRIPRRRDGQATVDQKAGECVWDHDGYTVREAHINLSKGPRPGNAGIPPDIPISRECMMTNMSS